MVLQPIAMVLLNYFQVNVYKIEISSIGFKSINESVDLQKDQKVNYYLEENIENLEEVVVTQNVEEIDIKKPIMSLNILSNQTIKQTRVLFGESDLLKSIQLLPGVSNAVKELVDSMSEEEQEIRI